MKLRINDDCINCGACAVECPTEAIFEPEFKQKKIGKIISDFLTDHFFIDSELCNECAGFDEFKCISICPMDAIK